MKNSRIIFPLFFFLITLISCKKEKETNYSYYIINDSNYKIYLQNYSGGEMIEDITILPSDNFLKESNSRGFNDPKPPSFGDSIKVIFNDTIAITHGGTTYDVNRNIKNLESYTGGSKETDSKHFILYEYEYIFTNDDYQEAVDNQ